MSRWRSFTGMTGGEPAYGLGEVEDVEAVAETGAA